jgi:hypothetical protein
MSGHHLAPQLYSQNTRWFKYDRDDLCVDKSQFVPVIFEPPCSMHRPTPVGELSLARVYGRLLAESADSNPAEGMDVGS